MLKRWGWLCFILIVIIGTGCEGIERPVELSFETLAKDSFPGNELGDAEITVAATAREGEDLQFNTEGIIDDKAGKELLKLDYNLKFVVLALRAPLGSGGFGTTVQRVIRQGNRVRLEAIYIDRHPDAGANDGFSRPFHLVVVDKDGAWGSPITFDLVVDDQIIATTTHMIP